MIIPGDEFAPDGRAARAYQKIGDVYATLATFTDPLFRPMADDRWPPRPGTRLTGQGLRRAESPPAMVSRSRDAAVMTALEA